MKSFWILVLPVILFFSLSGCESQEALEPIKHPRFGVALVQEVSEKGVQFGANVFEIGSQEVIEYGFVYSKNNINPKTTMDDMVSIKGRPGDYFELFANHSLQVGQKYYVAAFMKTEDLVIYSKSEEFVSQGSDGFLITSVEWPEKIYKFQSLTIKGQRLSRSLSNYQVKIDQYNVSFSLLDSNTLIVDLPSQLLTETTGKEKEVELNLQVAGKSFTQKKIVTFQEPVFEKLPLQLINFDQEVVIKGDFLDLGEITIKIGEREKKGQSAQKNEMKFRPYLDMGFLPSPFEQEVVFTVRGQSYFLGNIFKINGPKISSEVVRLSKNSPIIPALNFDISNWQEVKFLDENGLEILLPKTKASTNGIEVDLNWAVFPSRKFNMQFSSFGLVSNFAEVEVNTPVVAVQVGQRSYDYEKSDPALIYGGNAVILTKSGIIEETLDGEFEQRKISDLPINLTQRYQYIFQAVKNGFVIGGGGSSQMVGFKDIYFYSIPLSRWERLPDLPELINRFKFVTSTGDYLVFEDPGILFEEAKKQTWALNIKSGSWEKISDSTLGFYYGQTFYLDDEVFRFGFEGSQSHRGLYRMGPDLIWSLYMALPMVTETSDFSTPILLDGNLFVYSSFRNQLWEISVASKEVKGFSFSGSRVAGVVPAVYGRGFYLLSNGSAHGDIRPDLF